MRDSSVRISEIRIENFKNIKNGSLTLENSRRVYNASVLGLYGQNGSGKTALIDAIELLQHALCGRPIPERFAEYINVDATVADIAISFCVKIPQGTFDVLYSFSIRKNQQLSDRNTDDSTANATNRVVLFNETLKGPGFSHGKVSRMGSIIETNTEDVFVPQSKYKTLIGSSKKTEKELTIAKAVAERESRSFAFSRELLSAFRVHCQTIKSDELSFYSSLIEALVNYGNYELFVINTKHSGLISLNAQPLSFKYDGPGRGISGSLMFSIEHPEVIPVDTYYVANQIIKNMNIVLEQIIPGLTVGISSLGAQLLPDGQPGVRIQMMSCRNKKTIPFVNESEGIKKIVSILQLLIVVYNDPSITVVIDEIDAGVFEYLLGELLKIISERGKGQLIFTSHNLRPLETIDRGFIAFTTTNPQNRYIRLTNVKENNNLRDFYYRDIVIGDQSEEVYQHTNNSEIALAFREAGEINVP